MGVGGSWARTRAPHAHTGPVGLLASVSWTAGGYVLPCPPVRTLGSAHLSPLRQESRLPGARPGHLRRSRPAVPLNSQFPRLGRWFTQVAHFARASLQSRLLDHGSRERAQTRGSQGPRRGEGPLTLLVGGRTQCTSEPGHLTSTLCAPHGACVAAVRLGAQTPGPLGARSPRPTGLCVTVGTVTAHHEMAGYCSVGQGSQKERW